MRTDKKLIERALKFSDRYSYTGITRGSIEGGQVTCCDNCGKLITNICTVIRHADKKAFHIGTDCCETLVKAQTLFNAYGADYQTDLYSFNKVQRVVTELNKGAELQINGIFATVKNMKGKTIDCSLFDLKKYYPSLLN